MLAHWESPPELPSFGVLVALPALERLALICLDGLHAATGRTRALIGWRDQRFLTAHFSAPPTCPSAERLWCGLQTLIYHVVEDAQ